MQVLVLFFYPFLACVAVASGFENLPLSDLMSEYARQDKHYDGVVESESTASSKDQNGSNLL